MQHRRFTRKDFLRWSAVATAGVAGAACQPAAAPAPAAPTQPAAAATEQAPVATEAPSPEKVGLVYWGYGEAAWIKADATLIEQYLAKHPEVSIVNENYPWDDFIAKLQTALAAGTAGDVIEPFGNWVWDYAHAGVLSSVPEDVYTMADLKSTFFEGQVEGYVYEGKVYGLPHEYNLESGGMLANPALFDEAGISKYPNATWEDLIQATKKLTKTQGEKITRAGFTWPGMHYRHLFQTLLRQYGGDYWAADGVHVDLTTDAAHKALTFLSDFCLTHKVTSAELIAGETSDADLFWKQQAALYSIGPWVIGTGQTEYPELKFEYIKTPTINSGDPLWLTDPGWGIIVSKATKNPAVAWDLAKFLTSAESSAIWNNVTQTVPAVKALAADKDWLSNNPGVAVVAYVLPYGKFVGLLRNAERFKKSLIGHNQAACYGTESVDEALTKANTEINAMIDEYVTK